MNPRTAIRKAVVPLSLLVSLAILASCQSTSQLTSGGSVSTPIIKSAAHGRFHAYESGDLIFRSSYEDYDRHRLSNAKDNRFSHMGLIAMRDNKPVVIHIHPLENGGVASYEPVDRFLKRSDDYAVYRVRAPASRRDALAAYCDACTKKKVRFDMTYDLTSTEKMYCTEMVWRAAKDGAGVDLVPDMPSIGPVPYLPLDTLWNSSGLVKVHDAKYPS